MPWPVVIAANGYGIPVTESDSDFAIPAEIAANGYGTPVVLVDSGGTPVKGVGGGAPPDGYGWLTDFEGNSLYDADGVRLYGAI